jgi:hypothetical protein
MTVIVGSFALALCGAGVVLGAATYGSGLVRRRGPDR